MTRSDIQGSLFAGGSAVPSAEFPRQSLWASTTMNELPDDTNQKIQKLSAEGDELAASGRFEDALKAYWAAWDLLPEPQTDWEAATWLLAAIGDA
ncbi:MAG: hypothetical protein ACOVRM_18050, partial [Planctomycetaceae bacterium]